MDEVLKDEVREIAYECIAEKIPRIDGVEEGDLYAICKDTKKAVDRLEANIKLIMNKLDIEPVNEDGTS